MKKKNTKNKKTRKKLKGGGLKKELFSFDEYITNQLGPIIFPQFDIKTKPKKKYKFLEWYPYIQDIDLNNLDIPIKDIFTEYRLVPFNFFDNLDDNSILWFKYFDKKWRIYILFYKNIKENILEEGNYIGNKQYLEKNSHIYKILNVDYENSKINFINNKRSKEVESLIVNSILYYYIVRGRYKETKILMEGNNFINWTKKDNNIYRQGLLLNYSNIDDIFNDYLNSIKNLKKEANKLPSRTFQNIDFDCDNLPLKIPIN